MKKVSLIIITFIIAGGAFYGGMKYTQSNLSAGGSQGFARGDFENMRDLSSEERQKRFQQMGGANMLGLRGGRPGDGVDSNFVAGEIILKDDQSVTIKLSDGGSKIIFYSNTTEVCKFVNGISDDLEVGKTITINGKASEDGSITAQSIQIRPEINLPQQ